MTYTAGWQQPTSDDEDERGVHIESAQQQILAHYDDARIREALLTDASNLRFLQVEELAHVSVSGWSDGVICSQSISIVRKLPLATTVDVVAHVDEARRP